jgi:hypothetical protein
MAGSFEAMKETILETSRRPGINAGAMNSAPEGGFKPDSSGVVLSPGIYARADRRLSRHRSKAKLLQQIILIDVPHREDANPPSCSRIRGHSRSDRS